jgi:hypothetical protein
MALHSGSTGAGVLQVFPVAELPAADFSHATETTLGGSGEIVRRAFDYSLSLYLQRREGVPSTSAGAPSSANVSRTLREPVPGIRNCILRAHVR